MIAVVLVPLGFLVGAAVGRWWTLVPVAAVSAAAGFGAELGGLPAGFVAGVYAASAAIGAALGVAARRGLLRRARARGGRARTGPSPHVAAKPTGPPKRPEPGRPVG